MANLNSRVAKAVKVFTKVQADLEKIQNDGSAQVVKIDDEIAALNADRIEIQTAMTQAAKINAKIFDILGDG